ncbi:MAG: beta-N-acetylhexosaminidase [Oscillospiraceae bacterium]|jgi:hypothetical protein|nr:beta-N-acetylhexosaminidase [Oscillospiraceae bacterium]
MFTSELVDKLRRDILLKRVDWDGAVDVEETAGDLFHVTRSPLQVVLSDSAAVISACDVPALSRGFFLLAKAISEGKKELRVSEHRRFDTLGAYIDCSRGAVMKPDAVCGYIDNIVQLGFNAIMLYTEDTFTIPEYPYFGYLRGRYTQRELRGIDDYAASLGVELIPSVQTLAHLEQFLQWEPMRELRDNMNGLLIDDDKTYEFLDCMIKSLRESYSSKRIHVGIDEAYGVGMGRYFEKHGAVDKFELLNRHVRRVTQICEKYGFEPIMWSDMYYKLGSKTGAYYDPESNIPQSVIDALPNVSMAYWDYYNTDEDMFEKMLAGHERMNRPLVFAGGVWTWGGFLPHVKKTTATMFPALRKCAEHNVKTVLATMWGDDGQECNHFLALNQLAIFSECCWRGAEVSKEETESVGAYLSGIKPEVYEAFCAFYEGAEDVRTGKALMWCDPLYPLLPDGLDLRAVIDRLKGALSVTECQAELPIIEYARALFKITIAKGELIIDIRGAYKSPVGATASVARGHVRLQEIAEVDIPALISLYEEFRAIYKNQWYATYKPIGWEEHALRLGSVIGRLHDVADTLRRYADGRISAIEELDYAPLPSARNHGMQFYQTFVKPNYGWYET